MENKTSKISAENFGTYSIEKRMENLPMREYMEIMMQMKAQMDSMKVKDDARDKVMEKLKNESAARDEELKKLKKESTSNKKKVKALEKDNKTLKNDNVSLRARV